jgi:prophage regulatory protein
MTNHSPRNEQLVAVLRRAQLEKILQLSRSGIYEKLSETSKRADPSFPRPIRYGNSRSVYWLESEVRAWLDAQVSSSRKL